MNKLYKVFQILEKQVDVEAATINAIFSTEDKDRHGDIVLQNWELDNFKQNPVILNSHNYDDAQEVIGKALDIWVNNGKLQGRIQFAVNENPKAKVIFDLYAGGYLNAFSVGFIPKEFDNEETILKSELLEISAVSVPANALALAKAKGIDVEALGQKQEGEEHGQPNPKDTKDAENHAQGTADDGNGGQAAEPEDKPENQQAAGAPADGKTDEPQDQPVSAEKLVAGAIQKMVWQIEGQKNQRIILLKSALQVISSLGEHRKVVTPPMADRAEEKRIINSAIRKLIKEKN